MAEKHNSKKSRKDDFIAALSKFRAVVQPALESVGISRQTYCRWRQEDPSFDRRCRDAAEEQKDRVEYKFLQKIDEGDSYLIGLYMKTKCKDRGYSERLDVTADVNATLTLPQLREKDEEILKREYGGK